MPFREEQPVDVTTRFLADLTAGIVAAGAGGLLARLLRITPVVGYLAAGVVIGPFTPGYNGDPGSLNGLGELGLILLVFSLGLGFSPSDLRRVGVGPLLGNAAAMGAIGIAAFFLARTFGVSHPLVIGLVAPLSSTAIGVALLDALGLRSAFSGQLAIAMLVAQDLFAVALLVVLATPPEGLTMGSLIGPMIAAIAFVFVAIVFARFVLNRLVRVTLARMPAELLIPSVTALALIAAWIGHKAGLSFEFGAFVAGAVISEAAGSRTAQAIVAPFKELFVMLFFVALGMSLDLRAVATEWRSVLGFGLAIIAVRFILWTGLVKALRQGWGTAIALGIALVPLGEFNMVLAGAANAAKRIDPATFSGLIGVTFVSIVVASVGAPLWRGAVRRFDAKRADGVVPLALESTPGVVLIGYGRTGRSVGQMLRAAQLDFAVIELHEALASRADAAGIRAMRGNGGDPLLLEAMLSDNARLVISTIPDSQTNIDIAHRLSARGVPFIARAEHPEDVARLLAAGAAQASVPESEGALGLGEEALRELGVAESLIGGYVVLERERLHAAEPA